MVKELQKQVERFIAIIRFVTQNCVDMKKASLQIDLVLTADIELEYQDKFILSLTERFRTYKKAIS
jgi:hypothetical protein